jgi:hypothetical protein
MASDCSEERERKGEKRFQWICVVVYLWSTVEVERESATLKSPGYGQGNEEIEHTFSENLVMSYWVSTKSPSRWQSRPHHDYTK